MMYEGFANVYDHMMNHIPYEAWFVLYLLPMVTRSITKKAK